MYDVFVRVLKTDKGKAVVRKYKGIFDARSIYQELQEYASKSTEAIVDANTLLQYITIASLSDGSWNGTTRHFVLHWMEQVRLYEELVDVSASLSDSVKLTLLTNAVRGHTKLSGVHTVAIQLASHFGQAVDFTKYSEMLLSECAQVDSALAHSARKSGQPSVYFTDLTIDDGEEDAHHQLSSADEVDYTIDSDPVTLMANTHKHREMSASRVLMHQDQWTGMQPEGQKIWDQLLGEDKASILKKKPTSNPPKPLCTFYNQKPNSIMANAHLLDYGEQGTNGEDDTVTTGVEDMSPPDDEASHENDASPADICNVLLTSSKCAADKPCQANTRLTYTVGKHRADKHGALIDPGANGGVAGADVRVIETTHRAVNVQGVSDHQVTGLKIVTAGGVVQTQHGPVIAIFHQYAHLGTGKTIHLSFQLEEFGLEVDKTPIQLPRGLQHIKTPDGYVHPIRIKGGLPYVSLRPYTDMEWETLPHVNWTHDSDWDPAIFNHEFDEGGDEWYDALTDHTKSPHGELFDEFGNYCKRQAAVAEENFVGAVLDGGLTVDSYVWYVNQVDLSKRQPEARHVKPGERDWETLRRFFSWASVKSVKKTFQATMQMGRLYNAVHLKEHCHSTNPALNVHHRQEPVATDYVYANVPAIDDGFMGAQIFVDMGSEACDTQGLKSPKQFVNSLEDNIQKCGAMDKLVSDQVQMEIGQREQDILQALFISSWQSKQHQQQQDLAERKYQMLRWYTNTMLSHTSVPANTWLLCLLYVCFLLNCLSCQSLQWRTPLEALEGSMPDISPLLHFSFWDPDYDKFNDSDFPSGSIEGRGRWIGIAENVGHTMTYQILTDDTKKVIYRSNVCSALSKEDRNKCVDLLGGEEVAPIINSSNDEDESPRKPMPIFDPTDLVGRTFLMDPPENGERYCMKILEVLVGNEEQLAKHPDCIKLICSVNDDMYEEILTYNEILEYIAKNKEQDAEQAIVWKFNRIAGHQGPLKKGDPTYNGSRFKALVEWETGESKYEPLNVVTADNPAMSLSSFRVAPRIGHIMRCNHIYAYLSKMQHAAIRVRTDEPDFSALPDITYDWSQSVYGNVKEVIPEDCLKPLGKHVTLSHYVDANLYYDMLSGCLFTGILHFVNKCPIDWYSKKQGTVEAATFGSEANTARTAMEQIIDLRGTLHYMGVPLRESSYMFGDNKTIGDSGSMPHAKLHKRPTMLSYYRVREAIASGMVKLFHMPGGIIPANILSKYWGHQQIWKQLQPLLFWKGDSWKLSEKKHRKEVYNGVS